MRVEVVPFGERLWPTLEPTWRSLGRDETSCFLSASWTEAWLRDFGAARRPLGLVYHDAGEAVGCALLSFGWVKLGPFPVRRAYLNASGVGVGCEHNDILVRATHRAGVLDDLVRRVLAEGVDELALVGTREGLMRELLARWPGGSHEGHLSDSPYVDLEALRRSGKPYLEALSSNTRSQIRRSTRLYEERFGPPELRRATSPDEAEAWFGEMASLHGATWRERGEEGAFADAAVRAFHLRLLREGAKGGLSDGLVAEVLRVRFGDEVVGFLYNLRYRGRVSFYQSGLAYHGDDNRLKPGLVAHALAVDHYLAAGEAEYDFLGGEPASVRYKTSLATDRRVLAWVELPCPSYKMRALRALRHARRRVRAALSRA